MKLNMKNRIFLILSLLVSCTAVSSAQEVMNSAYFLDGYSFRHEYNPAFVSARSYFAIPIGDINVSTNSKMGLSTFIYPYKDGLTTFMNSSAVSSQDFLKKLRKNNSLNAGLSTTLLSMGIWGNNGGFTSVGLKVKAGVAATLPYDLFDFMKNVGSKSEYDISNLGVRADSYMELSVGHSRKIGDRLNVGAKVKFLVGLAAADVHIDNMKLTMKEDKWTVAAQGSAQVLSGKGLINVGTKDSGEVDFKNISLDPAGAYSSNGINGIVGGYGAAIDLGATYEVLEGLTVSASVLDLGFISWNNSINAATNDSRWEFSGFEDVSLEEGSDNSLKNQFAAIGDKMMEMVVLYKKPETKAAKMLACRVNAGVEYEMPFYRKLSVGALYSGRYRGAYSFNEGRLALTVSPTNWFSFSGSYGLSNYGSAFGAALNLHSAAVSLYLATDALFWDVTAPVAMGIGLPYKNLNLGLNFGLVFNVSRRKDIAHDRY